MTDDRKALAGEKIEWGSLATSEEYGLDVIRRAYGWTIAVDGTVCGLVAGDMGYDFTHITIPREHLDFPDTIEAQAARIAELEAALTKVEERVERAADMHHVATEWKDPSRNYAPGELETIWDWIFEPSRAALASGATPPDR